MASHFHVDDSENGGVLPRLRILRILLNCHRIILGHRYCMNWMEPRAQLPVEPWTSTASSVRDFISIQRRFSFNHELARFVRFCTEPIIHHLGGMVPFSEHTARSKPLPRSLTRFFSSPRPRRARRFDSWCGTRWDRGAGRPTNGLCMECSMREVDVSSPSLPRNNR